MRSASEKQRSADNGRGRHKAVTQMVLSQNLKLLSRRDDRSFAILAEKPDLPIGVRR
jgi:hypothetical protein